MSVKSKRYSHRGLWRLALVLLVVIPFLPEIAIYAVGTLAKIKGCNADGRVVCLIGTVAVSDTIAAALETGLLRAASFSVGIGAIWLALCYFVVTQGWSGILSRLSLAFAITMIFAFLPYLGPLLAISHLVNPNCRPNEGGVGPCLIFGGNVGTAAHDAVTAPWLILSGVPIAFGAFVIYVIVTIIIRVVSGKRTVASA